MRLKYQDSDLMKSNRRKDFGRKGSPNRSSKYRHKKSKNAQKRQIKDNLFGEWEDKMKTFHKETSTKKSSKSFFSKYIIIIIIFIVLIIIIYYLMNREESDIDPISSKSNINSYLSNNSEYSITASDRSYLSRKSSTRQKNKKVHRRKVLNLLETTKFLNTPVSKGEIRILDDT